MMGNTGVDGWPGGHEQTADTEELRPEHLLDAPQSGLSGLWRPAGLLDYFRLHRAPIVAHTRVRSDDPLRPGDIIVLQTAGGPRTNLWARVVSCTPDGPVHQVVLALFADP